MKISVVLPALISNTNQLAMSIKCIELARDNTKIPFELIIVETETDHLKDFADIHIFEKERTTCTKSINRGFGACSGDYVVLLTNDVYVGSYWLECLVECFKIDDCGLSTLATYQLNHIHKEEISEGIWFSVAMIPRSMARFDDNYVNSWDDTDLIMRTYLDGKKMYRNHKCIVKHLVGATEYNKADHYENYIKNELLFKEKYKDHKDNRIYKILTEGIVI